MAQTTIPRPAPDPILTQILQFPPQLKAFFELSDDQIARIRTVQAQFTSFYGNKILRQYQLQAEIAAETAKPTPDPLALGIRYAEIESIHRALQTQLEATVGQAQAVLSAGQKAKISTLQQALSLYSTACNAVIQNLMSVPVIPQAGNMIPTERVPDLFPVTCGAIQASLGGILSPTPIVSQP